MKKTVAFFASVVCVISILAGCGNQSSSLYYNYDLDEYITVGQYSETVSRSSSTFRSAYNKFYDDTFGDDLLYECTEGVIEDGDIANIDYSGTVDGEAFTGGTSQNCDLTIGSNTFFVDGFEDSLIGMEIGSTVELYLTLADDFQYEEYAGRDAVFSVTINYATKYGEPTDANVTHYGYGSATEYEKAAEEYAAAVTLYFNIYDALTVDVYPTTECDCMYDNAVAYMEDLAGEYGYTMEEYIKLFGYTSESFDAYLVEDVRSTFSESIVAYYVLQKNDTALTEEDVEAKRTELSKEYDDLEAEGYYEINIQHAAAYDKAIKLLTGKAEITD